MKKNVLLIIPYLTDGGAERVVSELSFALSEKFNVFVVLYEDRVTYPYLGKKIVLNIPSNSHPLVRNLALISRIRNIKRENSINCSISFLVSPNLINVLSKGKEKIILTVHTHLSEYNKRKTWMERLWNKATVTLIYNQADYVVAVSKGVEADLASNFNISRTKLRTIYNFYAYEKIRNLATDHVNPNHTAIFEKPVVINIGRLTYSKGQWNLLRAFRKVRQALDVNLVILGEGKYQNEYLRMIKMYNLESSVFLLGFQSNPYALIKRSSLLVSSSKFEGLSNVILEAIGLGIPVIATDCKTGPREILAPSLHDTEQTEQTTFHQFGVLIPVTHPEKISATDELTLEETEMANAIITVLKEVDTRKRYSQLGIERASHFEISNQIDEWIELIEC